MKGISTSAVSTLFAISVVAPPPAWAQSCGQITVPAGATCREFYR